MILEISLDELFKNLFFISKILLLIIIYFYIFDKRYNAIYKTYTVKILI